MDREKPVLKLSEYVDPVRFPVTTKPELSVEEQLATDAFNYVQLQEHLVAGHALDEEQQACWLEFQVKWPSLAMCLARGETAPRRHAHAG